MAIVLLSGGQDSTTALLWAQHTLKEPIHALSFAYGQRHGVELQAAARIARKLGVPHEVLEIGSLWASLGVSTALTHETPIVEKPESLPTTFVPGRNLLFLTVAAIWGYPRGEHKLLLGVSQVDYSGYPDCREPFLRAAQEALSRALDGPVEVMAPFLFWDKAQLWRYADDLGYREFIVEETHTCYLGERSVRHAWGYGCGECPACRLRKAGFDQAFG
uniref:7-cyano-7-deazaguanine synthase n=1 Tax=uncultured Bacteroidota bacterium TaxID=152509 RepID=H5SMQ4_9BACT|nr:queuosine biosynthesis protein QueC [uncultured Bacteroidetes bacterium]